MDGAVYLGGNHGVAEAGDTTVANGVAIPDFRLGAKAYYGNFKAKTDVGLSYGKTESAVTVSCSDGAKSI